MKMFEQLTKFDMHTTPNFNLKKKDVSVVNNDTKLFGMHLSF